MCRLTEIVQILGLDICADTIVGDPLRRGISGGQKKRVTTGSYRNHIFLYKMIDFKDYHFLFLIFHNTVR